MDNTLTQWGNSTRAQDIINNITGVGLNPAPTPAPAAARPPITAPEFPKNSWESYSTSPKRAIRTYQADTADLLRTEPVSLAHITITEQSRGTHAQVIRNFASSAKNYGSAIKSFIRVVLYTLISLLLVSGAVVLLILGISQYKFGFLGQGLNNLADNYAQRIYVFFGFTKIPSSPSNSNGEPVKPVTPATNNSGSPVFNNTNNQTGGSGQNNPTPTQKPPPVVSKPPVTNTGNNTGAENSVSTSGLMIRGIIKADYESSVSIRRGVTLSNLIQGAIANKDLKDGELLGINIYNPKDNGAAAYLTSSELFIAIASRAPESVRKSLMDDFVVGYSGPGQNPFLILTTNDFSKAFAGMLTWESSLYDDFATIFSLPTFGGASALERPAYDYKDGLILSRDVRILKSSGNRPSLYYGFVDKNTILFTTSDTVFKKITEKLDSGAYIRQK